MTLTKKRKRGRPSKKDKEIFDTPHLIAVDEKSIVEDIEKYVKDNNLPLSVIGYDMNDSEKVITLRKFKL